MTGSISEVSSASTWRLDIRRQRAPSVTESANAATGPAGARRATPAAAPSLARAGRTAVAVDSDIRGLLFATVGGFGGGAAGWAAGSVAGQSGRDSGQAGGAFGRVGEVPSQ